MNESLLSTFKAGDLVKVEGTYQEDMPASKVGVILNRWSASIYEVQFVNGVIHRIWAGHLKLLTLT